jgi:hypothetical protein
MEAIDVGKVDWQAPERSLTGPIQTREVLVARRFDYPRRTVEGLVHGWSGIDPDALTSAQRQAEAAFDSNLQVGPRRQPFVQAFEEVEVPESLLLPAW